MMSPSACTVVMWWPSTKTSVLTMLGEEPLSIRHSFRTWCVACTFPSGLQPCTYLVKWLLHLHVSLRCPVNSQTPDWALFLKLFGKDALSVWLWDMMSAGTGFHGLLACMIFMLPKLTEVRSCSRSIQRLSVYEVWRHTAWQLAALAHEQHAEHQLCCSSQHLGQA